MAASVALARKLLHEWTVARYLATRPPSHVVTVTADSTVGEALAALNRHGILSAPLTAENGDVVGVVSMRDVLAAFLHGVYPGTTLRSPARVESARYVRFSQRCLARCCEELTRSPATTLRARRVRQDCCGELTQLPRALATSSRRQALSSARAGCASWEARGTSPSCTRLAAASQRCWSLWREASLAARRRITASPSGTWTAQTRKATTQCE